MPKGGKATVRAGNKRGASQPPQSQPTPKAPRRVSALDLALQFGLYAVQNEKMQNVAELAETCLNQNPATGRRARPCNHAHIAASTRDAGARLEQQGAAASARTSRRRD